MAELFSRIAVVLYFTAAAGLLVYGFNCYVMIFLFTRRRREVTEQQSNFLAEFGDPMLRADLPTVTTQIAVYNELNVVERVMRAACAMQYPEGKHEIQVLDDSTDETSETAAQLAAKLRDQGHDICVIRRNARTGFKAGALANGLAQARGMCVAVFDADFVPEPDYLLRTIPFFMCNEKLGLAQARWGHLNRSSSLFTQAQSIGIDGHFMVEQSARNWNGLFMNFNGTAGVWRKQAIDDSGGWQWDTLTEDMDLSYRVQLAGWQTVFLQGLVVPAEIPEDVSAFKSQQFRWAKGSIQTALKLFPLLRVAPVGAFRKLQAFFHLTHYMVHPLMLTLALLALPVLLAVQMKLGTMLFVVLAAVLLFSMCAPSALYVVSQRAAYPDWWRRIIYLPALVVIGVGVALSNSRGVFEAIIGKESGFVRTPKRGDKVIKHYHLRFPWLAALEILVGLYCTVSLCVYLQAGKYLVGPFLAIYAAGFLFIGLLTIAHSLGLAERG